MSTSMASVSKFFESLMRFPVAPDPCGFDDGMDEPEDPSDYLQNDSITNDELRGGLSTLRAEQVRPLPNKAMVRAAAVKPAIGTC